MVEPRTQLIKEYLELNGYFVRVDYKFNKQLRRKRKYKKAKPYQTASDIDIVAIKKNQDPIVAEVKGGTEIRSKEQIDELYGEKFKHIDNPKVGWVQLRKILKTQKYRRIIYCFSIPSRKKISQERLLQYAKKKYKLEIIPLSQILIDFFDFRYKEKKWTFYADYPYINLIRLIMDYLTYPDYYTYKGKNMEIEDLLLDNDKWQLKKIVEHNKGFFKKAKKILS
ncbi:hypothetical protein KY366_04235 [Candidatus Woesearchaeota archaeon]|nr:hypothetical protein [Candidatus Woesearchaeota archaeon]